MTYEERLALLTKMEDMIGEHVEAFVFIAKVDDENGEECIIHRYDGGRAQALGLLRCTQLYIETRIANELTDEEVEDEE